MELPQIIKQEKVDYFAIEPGVKLETNILNSIEVNLEPMKTEPHLYVVHEPNNLVQFGLTKEVKMVGNSDKCLFNCSLSEIKLEGSEAIDRVEKIDNVDVKWAIKNDELIIKEEKDTEDEELGKVSTLVSLQQQRKTHADSDSKQNFSGENFSFEQCECRTSQEEHLKYDLGQQDKSTTMMKCKICEYKTVDKIIFNRHVAQHKTCYKCDHCDYIGIKGNLNRHLLRHKNSDEVDKYKCDQCDYQTVRKDNLKKHGLKHKSSEKVDTYNRHVAQYKKSYKCDQCDYMGNKGNLNRHLLKHKNLDEVDKYKCDQCEYQTVRKDHLKIHGLKHKNSDEVDTFKCDQCDYQTRRKWNMKGHLSRHRNCDKITCDQCVEAVLKYEAEHKISLK